MQFDFVTGATQAEAIRQAKARRWRKYTVHYSDYWQCWIASHTTR